MDFQQQINLIKADFEKSRRMLIAIGDETRQSILVTLMSAECGGMRVGEITKKTHLSRPAVSHHLKVLLDAGLVAVWHKGTMNFYTADIGSEFQHLIDLTRHAEEYRTAAKACGGENCGHGQ